MCYLIILPLKFDWPDCRSGQLNKFKKLHENIRAEMLEKMHANPEKIATEWILVFYHVKM